MSAVAELEQHAGPELRDRHWTPDRPSAEDRAKERSTCGRCLARTYRGNEDCICEPGLGTAEVYEEALEEEENTEPNPADERAAATFFDPHGNHVETIEGTCEEVGRQAGDYLARMAAEGYPCSVIIEPEEGS